MKKLLLLFSILPTFAFGAFIAPLVNTTNMAVTPTNFFSSNILAGANITLTKDAQGRLTIDSSGGGGGGATNAVTSMNLMTNAQQKIEFRTNSIANPTVNTNGAGSLATNYIDFPWADNAVNGLLHSNWFQAFRDKQPGNTSLTNWGSAVVVVTNVQQLTNAVKVISNNIVAAAGIYDLGGQALPLTNGVSLHGQGVQSTILRFNSASTLYCVQPGDNNRLGNLTILCTNKGSINIPFGLSSTTSATNTVVEAVEMDGQSDCIYARDNSEIRFLRCVFSTAWDACFQFGGTIEFYNCSWKGRGTTNVNNGASVTGIRQSGGTNRVFGGAFDLRDGVGETLGVWCAAGRSELYGPALSVTSSSGRVRSITNSAGTVVAYNCFPNAPADGTITSGMNLLSIEGSFAREIRNITSASGKYTNTALTDRFIAFDVSSIAGTNTLPDIGFQTALSCIVSNQPTDGDTFTIQGIAFTWKNSPVGSDQIQIGTDQADSAFWLSVTVPSYPSWDPLIAITTPTTTNVTFTSRPDQVLTHSASGTWSVRVLTTNDYATTEGRLITVYDSKGSAGTRNIKVSPQRNASIDGATSYLITNNYGSATFQAVGTNWVLIHDASVIRFPIPGSNVETNSATVSGVVKSGSGQANKFWGTDGSGNPDWRSPSGSGDFVGPGSATDNAAVRFDTTTGKLGQNSVFIIDDSGNSSTPGGLFATSITSTNGQTNIGTSVFLGPVIYTPVTVANAVWGNVTNTQTITLTGNTTLLVTNFVLGSYAVLDAVQDSTGTRTLAFTSTNTLVWRNSSNQTASVSINTNASFRSQYTFYKPNATTVVIGGPDTAPSRFDVEWSGGTVPSSDIATRLSDETGSGSVVFSASPTFTGNVLFNGGLTTFADGIDVALPSLFRQSLGVSGAFTVSGETVTNKTRWLGSTLGWVEHSAIASGASNSFVWSQAGSMAAGQFVIAFDNTTQAGTNSIKLTNSVINVSNGTNINVQGSANALNVNVTNTLTGLGTGDNYINKLLATNDLRVQVGGNTVASNAWVGGTWGIINVGYTNRAGDAALTNAAAFVIKAGMLTNLYDQVEFMFSGAAQAATATTNQVQVTYGSETICDTGVMGFSNSAWNLKIWITRTGNSNEIVQAQFFGGGVNAQSGYVTNFNGGFFQTNGIDTTLQLKLASRKPGGITNDFAHARYWPAPH